MSEAASRSRSSEAPLAATGELATTRPDAILKFCERVRFSGTLAFTSDESKGALPMLAGIPEIDTDDKTLEAALDEFLVLEKGTYTLKQLLPALDGATKNGELALQGSLDKLTPSDLLRYCEAAGLTGTLKIARDESSYAAGYVRGELQSVTVDGDPDADLTKVFAWTEGRFDIEARSVFVADPADSEPQESALLRTLEVALTEIMDRSAKGAAVARPRATTPSARPPSILRGATLPFGIQRAAGAQRPPTAPPPANRPARTMPPPGPDATVRVYFVDKGPPALSKTRHAAAHLGSEVVALDPGPRTKSQLPEKPRDETAPYAAVKPVASSTVMKTPENAFARASATPRLHQERLMTAGFAIVLAAALTAALVIVFELVR